MPRRRPLPRSAALAACAVMVTIGLGGCGLGRTGASIPKDAAIVQISHMAFMPPNVEVRVGQPVAWKFDDAGVVHDVVGLSGPVASSAHFRSPDQENGSWVHTFTTPGTYRYYCSLHTYMRGTIIVDP